MLKDYIRKDLIDFMPYEPEQDIYDIKLDANENNYGHLEAVIQEIRAAVTGRSLIRYTDSSSSSLLEALAAHYQVGAENITLGVGSDQLIDVIARVFIEPGDPVLLPSPSFSMFKHSVLLSRGRVVEYPLDAYYDYSVDQILEVYHRVRPKYIILCSPNNPTGNILSLQEIRRLLQAVSCPVIVDEAYGEFTQASAISLIAEAPHLLVLRTFSKLFGLAGLRLGYAIGSAEMIEALKLALPPYNISSVSLEAGRIVLKHLSHYEQQVKRYQQEKEFLMEAFKKLDYITQVYPSHTNFLLVRTNKPGIAAYLRSHSVSVKDFSAHPRMPGCLRITVGTEEENRRLLNLLTDFIG